MSVRIIHFKDSIVESEIFLSISKGSLFSFTKFLFFGKKNLGENFHIFTNNIIEVVLMLRSNQGILQNSHNFGN
jgi:hypothetical protein